MVTHHSKLHQCSWDRLHSRGRTGQNGSRKGKKTSEAIVELPVLHSSPISGICWDYALARACHMCRKWESRVLHLCSSYLLFSLAEADSSFPWMVYFIGSYTIQISLVALCLFMLEMKAQNSTAVLGRQLHSLLGCYTLSPCQDNLKLLPSSWWWDFAVLQCTAIERAVLGLLVKCAQMCHGTGNFSSSSWSRV